MASNYPNGGPGLPPSGGSGFHSGGPIVPAGMIDRIKNILVTPKTEWPRITLEADTAQQVFLKYVVPLAAIAPIATLIHSQVFGYSLFGITWKPSIAGAITNAVIGYVLSLVGTWAAALVVDALAPTFGGVQNRNQAMKVVAYSWTAAWVAGIFNIVPVLGFLAILGLYSLYLLWLGLPVLMRSPPDKSVGYVIVTILVMIVVYVVIIFVTSLIAGLIVPDTMPALPTTGHIYVG